MSVRTVGASPASARTMLSGSTTRLRPRAVGAAAAEMAGFGRVGLSICYWVGSGRAGRGQPVCPVSSCAAPTGFDSGEPRWRR
jgi:hypothetical protein